MRVVQMVYLDTIRGPLISGTAEQAESQEQIRQKPARTRTRHGRPNTTASSSDDAQRGIQRTAFPSDGASHRHIQCSNRGSFLQPKGTGREGQSSTGPSHAQHDATASDATALGMGDVTLRPHWQADLPPLTLDWRAGESGPGHPGSWGGPHRSPIICGEGTGIPCPTCSDGPLFGHGFGGVKAWIGQRCQRGSPL